MYVVIDENNYFVSILREVTSDDLVRSDVIQTEDRNDLTTAFKYLDGQWVPPPPQPPEDGDSISKKQG